MKCWWGLWVLAGVEGLAWLLGIRVTSEVISFLLQKTAQLLKGYPAHQGSAGGRCKPSCRALGGCSFSAVLALGWGLMLNYFPHPHLGITGCKRWEKGGVNSPDTPYSHLLPYETLSWNL